MPNPGASAKFPTAKSPLSLGQILSDVYRQLSTPPLLALGSSPLFSNETGARSSVSSARKHSHGIFFSDC